MVATPGLQSSLLARSWSRYWAKMTDLFIFSVAMNLAVATLLPRVYEKDFFYGPIGKHFYSVLLLPFVLTLETIILYWTGSTPGKKIAGIKVMRVDGVRPTFRVLLLRNAVLWWWGLAAGISFIGLYTLFQSKRKLDRRELLRWDAVTDTRCFDIRASRLRLWLNVGCVLAIFIALSVVGILRTDSALEKSAHSIEPGMQDKDMRLDSADVYNLQLTYRYTDMSVSKSTDDLSMEAKRIQNKYSHGLTKIVCAEPGAKPVLRAGASIIYRFRAADGFFITSIEIKREDCSW